MRVLSSAGGVVLFVQLFARMLVCMDVHVATAVIAAVTMVTVPGRIIRMVMRTLRRADPVLESRHRDPINARVTVDRHRPRQRLGIPVQDQVSQHVTVPELRISQQASDGDIKP